MRREIYNAVRTALLATGAIQHVDLWNHNVEFLEQEQNWPMPAVFIEFDPIEWDRVKEPSLRCRSSLRLHIITQWNADSPLEIFNLPDVVRESIEGLRGEKFYGMLLSESHTNHNHEEIAESIEVYSYRGQI